MKSLFRLVLRLLLPAALLLAQHGVWAHAFAHDLDRMAGHTQNDLRHDCCLPFQAAGDAACSGPPTITPVVTAPAFAPAPLKGRDGETVLPYTSRAPPPIS